MSTTLYDELGVTADAADHVIKRALARERKTWVPRQNSAESDKREHAEARVQKLDDIEQTLLNPIRRRAYDLNLAIARGERPRSSTGTQPYVTLEALWHGDQSGLDTVRKHLRLTQGSAIKLSRLTELLDQHPQYAARLRCSGSASTFADQLAGYANEQGLRWRRE